MITGQEIFDNYNKVVELYNKFNELKKENEQLKQQNEKTKCCYLCKHCMNCAFSDVFNKHCCDKWELAE